MSQRTQDTLLELPKVGLKQEPNTLWVVITNTQTVPTSNKALGHLVEIERSISLRPITLTHDRDRR